MQEKTAVLVGRYQPLHRGHENIICDAIRRYENVIVVVGSAEKSGEPRNPLTYQQRQTLLKNRFTDIHIVPVTDQGGDIEKWVHEVEKQIKTHCPTLDFIALSGNDWVIECFESMKHATERIDERHAVDGIPVEASVIRERILQKKSWRQFVSSPTFMQLKEIGFEKIVRQSHH